MIGIVNTIHRDFQMDLHQLTIFAKVYELKSLSRSAEAVFLSQPTISGHLKKLEEELGVVLFDRLGRGVAPTRAAEVLYGYARRLLALRNEALEAVTATHGQVRGRLEVGASTIPGNYLLPGYLVRMKELHPELSTSLVLGDTASVIKMVEEGRVELGLVGAKLANRRLEMTACWADRLTLVAHPDSPLAEAGEIKVADLGGVPYLVREAGSGTRISTAKALAELGFKTTELEIVAELGSTESIRRAILAGLGVSIISRLAVDGDLAAGRLVEIRIEGLDLRRSLYLVTRVGRSLSPGGTRLAELILKDKKDD